MSNIVNLKLGTDTVTKILQDDILKETGNDILKWYKVANDAGGYYCRGIFVQPVGNNNAGFWWYWDLGCQTGIKDNGDWNQFGYIYDGDNKNITSGMTLPFSNPGNWDTTANYNDGWFFQILIVGDHADTLELAHPITIQFVDDRFDSCRFEVIDGTTLSGDKRTLTITKLTNSSGVVCKIKGATNWSKTDLETNLKDIIVNVHGLQSNALIIPNTDWGSVEIWDVSLGNNEVYKKERTTENYLIQYGLLGEQVKSSSKRISIGYMNIPSDQLYKYTDQIYIPSISDFYDYYQEQIIKPEIDSITFNVKQSNKNFWNLVKTCCMFAVKSIHTDYDKYVGLFASSNIDGEITLHFVGMPFVAGDNAFDGCNLTKINFTFDEESAITSLNKIFNNTPNLQSIETSKPLRTSDLSGWVSASKVSLTKGQVWWCQGSRVSTNVNNTNIRLSGSFTSYFLDNYQGTTIEQYGDDRLAENNTISCVGSFRILYHSRNITSLGPVLDFKFIKQELTTIEGCDQLTDIRIKNLNHGDWIFDNVERNGVKGSLPNLDADSVEYLFENLYDLTTNNPDLTYTGSNDDEYGQNPWVDHANIYCPQQWQDKITPLMVDNAQLKGWSVYINNILQ